MATQKRKARPVKKNDKTNDSNNIGPGLPENPSLPPVTPKVTQAKVNKGLSLSETTPEDDTDMLFFDDIEEYSNHVESISQSNSLDIYIDGVNQHRRHEHSIPANHLVKRNPYVFFWAKKTDMVGRKVKGYDLVCRELWDKMKRSYKASVMADHSPSEDYIQNRDMVLCFMKHANWDALHQHQVIKTNVSAKKQLATRAENSKKVAMQVEETGDMSYAETAYSNDKAESIAMEAQTEHVKQGFDEDISTIMKRLESGQALSPEQMEQAVNMTSSAKEVIEKTYNQ